MAVFKKIKPENIIYSEHTFHKTHTLSSSVEGVHAQSYVSGAYGITGSYWESLRINFYLSGSKLAQSESRLNNPNYSLADYVPKFPVHINKFHSQKSTQRHGSGYTSGTRKGKGAGSNF